MMKPLLHHQLRSQKHLFRFFAALIGCYLVWFVVYDMWLAPDGGLDKWVSYSVAFISADILDLFGLEARVSGRVVYCRTGSVEVVDGCNGLKALGLFFAFVLAYPGKWKRRVWFLPLGLAIVFLANVARVSFLAATSVEWPELFDLVHNIGVSTFFYIVIFLLWMTWAHLGDPAPQESQPDGWHAGTSL